MKCMKHDNPNRGNILYWALLLYRKEMHVIDNQTKEPISYLVFLNLIFDASGNIMNESNIITWKILQKKVHAIDNQTKEAISYLAFFK